MATKHNNSREKAFERELAHVAAIMRCRYFKIPDVVITAEKLKDPKNYIRAEEKRPFDGVLVTPSGTYCIECKYMYKPMEKHQRENLSAISAINGMGYVLRKIEKFDDTGYRRLYVKYRVQKDDVTLFEVGCPKKLMQYFIDGAHANINDAEAQQEECAQVETK